VSSTLTTPKANSKPCLVAIMQEEGGGKVASPNYGGDNEAMRAAVEQMRLQIQQAAAASAVALGPWPAWANMGAFRLVALSTTFFICLHSEVNIPFLFFAGAGLTALQRFPGIRH
jgi:hypothetical protein